MHQAAPRPWSEAPIDSERLIRARAYLNGVDATDIKGVYSVGPIFGARWGGRYTVDLRKTSAGDVCDCGDHAFREQLCKHALAALMVAGDRRVLDAWAQLLAIVANAQADAPSNAASMPQAVPQAMPGQCSKHDGTTTEGR